MNSLRTILLAEDNPNDVELTVSALSKLHLLKGVTVVNDGVEVMDYLRYGEKYKQREKANPAVLLLDIKMPRMDGIDVLRAIRNDPAIKSLPIVMLTSSREEPDLKICYELGVNAYVVKPVDFKEFMDVVKQLGIFWAIINEISPDL